MIRVLSVPILAPVLALGLLPREAFAELEVCNDTTARVSVAVGYHGTADWMSEGWWGIDPGACKTVIGGALNGRYYYYRGTSPSKTWESDSYFFCTSSRVFEIEGDKECTGRGYEREGFREIVLDEGVTSYSLRLTASAPAPARKEAEQPPAPKTPAPSPVADYTAEAGTHGEPYSINATFQGCWAVLSEVECEFHVDGWRYFAQDDGLTDPRIIDSLNALDAGVQMLVSGDLKSYAGDRAEITIRSFELLQAAAPAAPAQDFAALMDHLQGYWDSDAGDGYAWVVEGNRLDVIYDANLAGRYFFELHPECAASDGRGPVIVAYPEEDLGDGPGCFLVTETAQRHLAVINVVEGDAYSFSYSN